ncbi:MAG TPA: DUF885 domain-containing protein [Novosphingobium sp.]|nr:DUF885 domain-containing protein [Novosphingobium sp.]
MKSAFFRTVVAAALLGASMPALAAPADDLGQVIAEHWQWVLKESPILASSVGDKRYDDKLPDISLAAADRAASQAGEFIKRLDAIPDAGLDGAARANKGILRSLLKDQVDSNRFGQRTMLFSTYSSPHQYLAGLAENLAFDSGADYRNYLKRLEQIGPLNQQTIAITREALAKGYVQPCLAMGGFENTVLGAVAGKAEQTRFFAPFNAARPRDLSESEWSTLKSRAVEVIGTLIKPEFEKFAAFYVKDYKPRCRTDVGASSLPQGKEWYALQARQHTTTSLTPEQIHQIGLDEVTRIRKRMDEVAAKAGFASRAAMIEALRTDPKYYARTPEELMAAASRQAKIIDGLMPRYFGLLPRLPYGVKEIPAETAETTTTAYYGPGSPQAGLAGNYFVNTSKLPQRPLYELPALTVHEAVPGHHHQIALQQELNLPEFRRNIAFFTAFTEGWGLYTEYLGEEMGIYDTPEKMMGRLSYEMWRACRLVVDTGMHAKGWTKAQAVQFMQDNTALSAANIEAEVNRYISWPGQALGYKIGEIKIRELRARAESELGAKFDLRRFHDAVLGQGSVPLDVLEAQIADWIAAEKQR